MNDQAKPPDDVPAGIPQVVSVQLFKVQVFLQGNQERPAVIAVPPDITHEELMSLAVYVLAQLTGFLPKGPQLEIARAMPPKGLT